jgi:hypothetical protein
LNAAFVGHIEVAAGRVIGRIDRRGFLRMVTRGLMGRRSCGTGVAFAGKQVAGGYALRVEREQQH